MKNLAHLYIFVSPSLMKATKAGREFALTWLGLSLNSGFSGCLGIHPDLLEIKPTGKVGLHSIVGIRSVLDQLALTPHAAVGRAILIEAADKMLPPTANALLKALEEPPKRSLIILTTSSPHRILPTIISRAQIMRIPAEAEVLAHQTLAPLFAYIADEGRSYSGLKEICESIQANVEQEAALCAKESLAAISTEFGELNAAAKQEVMQEVEASSAHALQSRGKQICEAVYLQIRDNFQDDTGVLLLLEAMRGIDAGADLSVMLSWFVGKLLPQRQ